MFNVNRLLRSSRPQPETSERAPADEARQPRERFGMEGLLSPLLARPRQRANTSAAAALPSGSAEQARLHRSPLRASMQPASLASTSSAPPLSIEQDVQQWLDRNLPMADRIPTGYTLDEQRPEAAAREALRTVANAIRGAAERGNIELKIDYGLPATTLPDAIGRLETLQKLSLLGTGLQALPNSLGQLHQLRHLQITGSARLKRLPPSLTRLPNLKILSLLGVPLEELPADIGHMQRLRSLALSHGVFERLPASVVELGRLSHMSLSHSPNLRELPGNIGVMQRLKSLEVTSNPKLEQLPSSLTQLDRLEELRLSSNQRLSQLPENIGQLRGLKKLSLNNCSALVHLPESVGDLSQLEVLDLRGTGLTTLPQSLDRLPARCEIKVSGLLRNQLDQIRNPQQNQPARQLRAGTRQRPPMPAAQQAGTSWDRGAEFTRALRGIDAELAEHFDKWMRGLRHDANFFGRSLTPVDMNLLDQVVAEAIASPEFRSSFDEFLIEHTIKRVNMDGMTQVGGFGLAVRGDVKTAFSEMLKHKLMHMRNHSAALSLLQEALRNPDLGLSREKLLRDRCELIGRAQMWPPLKAYITMHDELGIAAQEAASTWAMAQLDEAAEGGIGEAEAMQHSEQAQAKAQKYTELRARELLREWGIH